MDDRLLSLSEEVNNNSSSSSAISDFQSSNTPSVSKNIDTAKTDTELEHMEQYPDAVQVPDIPKNKEKTKPQQKSDEVNQKRGYLPF